MSPFEYQPKRPKVATITVAANTAQSSPSLTTVVLGPNVVIDQLRIKIPPGHSALTGIALRYNAVNFVPFDEGTFLVGDGDEIPFDLGFPVWGRTIQVATYNTDRLQHKFYLTFVVSDIPLTVPGSMSVLAPELIEAVSLP